MSLLADGPAGPGTRIRVLPLGEQHRGALARLVALDPLVNVVADARLRAARRFTTRELGGPVSGAFDEFGTLTAAVLDAGSVHPIGGGPQQWRALAEHIGALPRGCSSIVAAADAVAGFWEVLEPHWGAARALRPVQPLLRLDRDAVLPPGHPGVRRMHMADLDAYLPAAAAMFAEELGISPVRGPGGARDYRARVAGLIAAGRAWGVRDANGTVVFKADLGCVTPDTVQVQGVWTHPDLRGRGIASRAMASVLQVGLDRAATVSLYVNDFNEPARRLYRRLGLTEHAVLSTVLF